MHKQNPKNSNFILYIFLTGRGIYYIISINTVYIYKETLFMSEQKFDNRELSWLKFNERVLEEAQDKRVPLLERLNFTSIFQSNLDEFFMVRVGSLFNKMQTCPDKKDGKSKMTPKQQLEAVFDKVNELEPMKDITYKNIMLELMEHGIEQVTFRTASVKEQQYLKDYFMSEMKPYLSPQIADRKTPFPFLKNKEIYCILQLQSKSGIKLGVIPATGQFSRIIPVQIGSDTKQSKRRFILAEQLILHFAPLAFKNYKVIDKTLVRVTRSAAIEINDELYSPEADFREIMEDVCQKRKKLEPVRLQLSEAFNQHALECLCSNLGIDTENTFYLKTPLDLSFVHKLYDMCDDNSLKYDKVIPQKSDSLSESKSISAQVKRRDVLLSYPYESIKPFIQLLNEAANDPKVTEIKITLYRLAKNSQIIEALCEAAENGKNVFVLVELLARFDEENNIAWSRRLQEAGCTICYGPRNMKVHSKLLLITRKIGRRTEYITQIGTGNYNEKTSAIYTDLSLITANPDIAEDAERLFEALKNDRLVEESDHLLIAPNSLRLPIIDMIEEEIIHAKNGEPGYIGVKVNSMCDKLLMKKLIEASCAGVKIDLVVRGICCLIAGIPGVSENITVTSIVGRYLEHSRVFIFGTPERCRIYMGSADFMTRNTVRRVEVATPVYDEKIKKRLLDMFNVLLSDNTKARKQLPDGSYIYKTNDAPPVDAQRYFIDEAYRKAKKKAAAKARANARKKAREEAAATAVKPVRGRKTAAAKKDQEKPKRGKKPKKQSEE